MDKKAFVTLCAVIALAGCSGGEENAQAPTKESHETTVSQPAPAGADTTPTPANQGAAPVSTPDAAASEAASRAASEAAAQEETLTDRIEQGVEAAKGMGADMMKSAGEKMQEIRQGAGEKMQEMHPGE